MEAGCGAARAGGRPMRVWLEGRPFAVDCGVLERSCDYFQALLRSGMMECQRGEVHLPSLPVRAFLTALAVSEGERPALSPDEAVEAAECAGYLQARPLARHLAELVDSRNCVRLCVAAATFGLWEVRQQAALLIRDMYQDLVQEAGSLPRELLEYVESLSPSSFVAVGTHSPSQEELHDTCRTVCYLDEDAGDWRHLTHLPTEASTSMAGVAVLANRLYLVGGVHGVSKQVVESSFCYDATSNTWSTFRGTLQPRYNFTLVGHEGRLYAVGGEHECVAMASVEACDLSTSSWSFVRQAPRPVAGAACAVAMSRIFMCFWRPTETTDIYEYTPRRDEWVLETTLTRPQSYGHCMVAHRHNLYVMRNGPSADFLRCLMDCYNVSTGQWSAVAGQYVNSKGALFTAVVRGDSAFTVNRALTLEYAIMDGRWRPRRELKGFPRSGSVWTFLLRLSRTCGPDAPTGKLSGPVIQTPSCRLRTAGRPGALDRWQVLN